MPTFSANNWAEHYYALQIHAKDPRLQAYYAAGTVINETPITAVHMLALDFETTGLDPQRDEIVSIGLVPFSLQRIYCREAKHWLVKPKTALNKDSVVIHGITHQDLASAPDFLTRIDPLLTAMAGRVIVVHCGQIEREFLNNALQQRLGEGIQFPVIDTMELERKALSDRLGVVGKLMGKPLGSLRLANCRQRYSLPDYDAHHALTDAMATAELLLAQVAHHYRPDTEIKALWSDGSPPR